MAENRVLGETSLCERDLREWSRSHGGVPVEIPAVHAADSAATRDYRTDPGVDFGKLVRRPPAFVLRPLDESQISACLALFRERSISVSVRAGGHSAGGQTLSGSPAQAVLDLAPFEGIVDDDPARESLTARANARWAHICFALEPQGRRPVTLIDHWGTTLGGTTSVGGFGDATTFSGLQIEHVTKMRVMTVDGETHIVRPGDALFDYSLAGRGQIAILLEITLRTMTAARDVVMREVEWPDVRSFVEGTIALRERGDFHYMRTRAIWHEEGVPIRGPLGWFADGVRTEHLDTGPFEGVGATLRWNLQHFRQYDELMQPAARDASRFHPALELVLPVPERLEVWPRICDLVRESPLVDGLPHGSSAMLVSCAARDRLPLAPLPDSDHGLLIALRPALPGARVEAALDAMMRIRDIVYDAGGRVYLMGVGPTDERGLEAQFGDALPTLRRLKREHDPQNLLNPGLLEGGDLDVRAAWKREAPASIRRDLAAPPSSVQQERRASAALDTEGARRTARRALFERHVQAFSVPRHPLVMRFRQVMDRLDAILEVSCKIDTSDLAQGARVSLDSVHASRFVLSAQREGDRCQRALALYEGFFRDAEKMARVELDRSLWDAFRGDGFDFSQVEVAFGGMDLRRPGDDFGRSRVKVYIALLEDRDRMERALELHGPGGGFAEAIGPVGLERMIVGFDFGLDGRAAIKIYVSAWRKDLEQDPAKRERVRAWLGEDVWRLAARSTRFHVSWDHRRKQRVIHFHCWDDPDEFLVRAVDNPVARQVHARHRGHRARTCFSLLEEELVAASWVRRLNMYYSL